MCCASQRRCSNVLPYPAGARIDESKVRSRYACHVVRLAVQKCGQSAQPVEKPAAICILAGQAVPCAGKRLPGFCCLCGIAGAVHAICAQLDGVPRHALRVPEPQIGVATQQNCAHEQCDAVRVEALQTSRSKATIRDNGSGYASRLSLHAVRLA